MYESWEDCARREVREEMNVELDDNVQYLHVINGPMEQRDNSENGKHYITIIMAGRLRSDNKKQVVQNMEPEKCQGWETFTLEQFQEMVKDDDYSSTITSFDSLALSGKDDPPARLKLFDPLALLVRDDPPALRAFLSDGY